MFKYYTPSNFLFTIIVLLTNLNTPKKRFSQGKSVLIDN